MSSIYDKRLDSLHWAIRVVLYGTNGGYDLGR